MILEPSKGFCRALTELLHESAKRGGRCILLGARCTPVLLVKDVSSEHLSV